jgi:glycosyltransferase involved in cell wall biosynthesis
MTPETARHRQKLLFISPVFPLPLDRGQHVRVYNLLLACCRQFEVTFVCPSPDVVPQGEHYADLLNQGVAFRFTGPAAGRASVAGMFYASWAARELMPPGRIAALAPYRSVIDGLRLDDYALCFVERGHLSPLAAGLYDRTIVDLDDLEHVRLLREMQLQSSGLAKLKSLPRLMRLVLRETLGLRRFKAAIVCSEGDRRRLQRLGGRNLVVVPNGASVSERESSQVPPNKDAVFLGNCHYPPNRDAIELLRTTIIPELRATHPDFVVDIIGPYSDEPDLKRDGLNGRGFVDDLPAALQSYKAMVAPLQLGGGTKLKILDAMAAGVAVVTTSIGAEGLELEHGKHAMIADDPMVFAQHVRTVLADAALRAALVENARLHVKTSLSWDHIRAEFGTRLEGWAAGGD